METNKMIDLHLHVGPDLLPRAFDANSVKKLPFCGLALKSHSFATVPQIVTEFSDVTNQKSQCLSKLFDESKSASVPELPLLIGSVTLNYFVGGLNPHAVYANAKLFSQVTDLPIIVWFPTIHADTFLKRSEYEIPIEWVGEGFTSRKSSKLVGIRVLTEKQTLTKEASDVLLAIKECNCVLATGHLAWEESVVLVKEAVNLGIKSIIITHPEYQHIDMPIDVQVSLSKLPGVYIEHPYAMYLIDKIPISKIASQIKAVGANKCILSSDMGQVRSPSPEIAMKTFCDLLRLQEITEDELFLMLNKNPKKILGIN